MPSPSAGTTGLLNRNPLLEDNPQINGGDYSGFSNPASLQQQVYSPTSAPSIAALEGYTGYSGYGQSPYSFIYGPYGYGSYGWSAGSADGGMNVPQPVKSFATVGRKLLS